MDDPRRAIAMSVAMAAVMAVLNVTAAAGQNTTNGGDLFRSYCVPCHGKDAQGTGPLANSLSRRPADLTSLAKTNGGDFPAELIARIIDGRNPVKGHGGGDMPVWGEALMRTQGTAGSEEAVKERIDSLVSYLRTLQR